MPSSTAVALAEFSAYQFGMTMRKRGKTSTANFGERRFCVVFDAVSLFGTKVLRPTWRHAAAAETASTPLLVRGEPVVPASGSMKLTAPAVVGVPLTVAPLTENPAAPVPDSASVVPNSLPDTVPV